MNTTEQEGLRAFGHQVDTLFGCRRDALFEVVDAVLSTPAVETLAHLSLSHTCRRGWDTSSDRKSHILRGHPSGLRSVPLTSRGGLTRGVFRGVDGSTIL